MSLHLVWANLKRKKLRTGLTVLSIMVAFVLFGLLCAIKQALVGQVQVAGADRLIVRHKVSIIQMLPVAYKERMERIPGVALVAHQTWFGGIYQDPKNFFMQCPVVPADFLAMHPEMVLPKKEVDAWLHTRNGAIVGRATAERFHWKIGDTVPIQSTIWARDDGNRTWEFQIVGIFDGRDKGTDTTPLFFRYDYFDEARRKTFGQGLVGWYTIRVKDPAQSAEIAKRIDEEFANSAAETKTEPEGAFVQGWASQVGNIGLIVGAILSAVFFTILLVTGSTMSQSVRERLGELGVLKAIGFTDERILGLVLGESCLIALLGGLVGLGLGWLLCSGGDPTNGLLPLFYLPPRDIALGVVIAVCLGLITGALPAIQALRLRTADALRRL